MGGSIAITATDVPRESLTFDDPGFNRDWVELKVLDTAANDGRGGAVEQSSHFFTVATTWQSAEG